MIYKWKCEECEFIGALDEFDKVKDPGGDDTWTVCRRCRTPEHVVGVCDEPGCMREATCGFPTPTGYRQTCGAHWRARDAS